MCDSGYYIYSSGQERCRYCGAEMISDRFKQIVEITLFRETKEVNDPDDSGGYTKWGISSKSYPDIDLHALDRDGAIEIYYNDFWKKPRIDSINDNGVAQKIFDCGVYMGSRRMVQILQKSINDTQRYGLPILDTDGFLGFKTECAVNIHPNPKYLLERIKVLTVKKICGFSNRKYLTGWIIRAISDADTKW